MRRQVLALITFSTVLVAGAAHAAAPSTDGCVFVRGTTVCATTTSEPAGTSAQASFPGCIDTVEAYITTTDVSAKRGTANGNGRELHADSWSFPTETRTRACEPSGWYPYPSSQGWGAMFYVHSLQPTAPLTVTLTFVDADGRTQTMGRPAEVLAHDVSNAAGSFAFGQSFFCFMSSSTLSVSDSVRTVSITADRPADCTA